MEDIIFCYSYENDCKGDPSFDMAHFPNYC